MRRGEASRAEARRTRLSLLRLLQGGPSTHLVGESAWHQQPTELNDRRSAHRISLMCHSLSFAVCPEGKLAIYGLLGLGAILALWLAYRRSKGNAIAS